MDNAEEKIQVMATREITTDDYLLAARLVARCRPGRVALVLDLLEKAGLDIPTVKETELIRADTMPDTVQAYVSTIDKGDIIGAATGEVYKRYVEYCKAQGKEPEDRATFGRCINPYFRVATKVEKQRDGYGRKSIRMYYAIGGDEDDEL